LPLPLGISSPCRRRTEPRQWATSACGSGNILSD